MKDIAVSFLEAKLGPFCRQRGGSNASLSRFFYKSKLAIRIPCIDQDAALNLFKFRREISEIVLNSGFGEWIFLSVGTVHYPVWKARKMVNSTDLQIHESSWTDGDLAKSILDSPYSAAIVNLQTNQLVTASKHIEKTNGMPQLKLLTRRPFEYIDLHGNLRIGIEGDQNATWEANFQELFDLNRDLQQQGRLENRSYRSANWEQRDGMWYVVPRKFRARSVQLVNFMDQLCRLTHDVEVVG